MSTVAASSREKTVLRLYILVYKLFTARLETRMGPVLTALEARANLTEAFILLRIKRLNIGIIVLQATRSAAQTKENCFKINRTHINRESLIIVDHSELQQYLVYTREQ